MEKKPVNPRLRQDQIAKELVCSSSTLQRYRLVTNMLSPYRIPPNSHKGDKEPQKKTSTDLIRPQMTPKDLN